jgi:dTDP-4-amino-4,6-dideoxygalactose transaminase
MNPMRIPITRPRLGDEEKAAVGEVLDSGFLVQGPRVAEFEHLVAEEVDAVHAVALSNCTAALRVSLLALGVGAGDVVVVTPYSWVATANVIELCGATPLFVDVDPLTFNMSPQRLAALLEAQPATHRIKAIMPVHTFGNPAGFDQLLACATAHGIAMVEDAACALGAMTPLGAAGSLGVVGCFSFHPRKIITTGEGGMLVTDDDAIAEFARSFRNHGQVVSDGVTDFAIAGDNLRLTEIQGALGVVQMGRLHRLLAERTLLADCYDDRLRAVGMTPQLRYPGAAVQSYVCLTPSGVAAAHVIGRLRADGIEATIGTSAIPFTMHSQETLALTDSDLPATAMLRDRALTLPLFPGMSDDQQRAVVTAIDRALT